MKETTVVRCPSFVRSLKTFPVASSGSRWPGPATRQSLLTLAWSSQEKFNQQAQQTGRGRRRKGSGCSIGRAPHPTLLVLLADRRFARFSHDLQAFLHHNNHHPASAATTHLPRLPGPATTGSLLRGITAPAACTGSLSSVSGGRLFPFSDTETRRHETSV
jgi:hypothetical protein